MLSSVYLSLLALIPQVIAQSSSLPQVDLGYEIHQAIAFNVCHLFSSMTLQELPLIWKTCANMYGL